MNAKLLRSATRRAEQYRISDLLVDVGQQRVQRAEIEIALPKLSFDLLLALIRAAPDIVSNDELMAQVWAGVIVSPETISQRVKLLRDALGDDPRAPHYIAGLRGRGYRLIPQVQPIEQTSDDASTVAAVPPVRSVASPSFWRRRWKVTLGLVACAALVGVTFFVAMTLSSKPNQPATQRAVTVLGLPPRTVAVLPFENLSRDPANEFLSLGMAEMVLNRLARVSDIIVIARSSSFAFHDQSLDAREIGRKLDARYLVEGGVQRHGDLLRVTARLIDAESGSQLEALHFDRPLAEIFRIQEEIADKVASALEATVSQRDTVRGPRSDNVGAYLAYLQGRALIEKETVQSLDEAAKHFARAIELDPTFAAAYVELASARMSVELMRAHFDDPEWVAALTQENAALVDKALALDSSLATAYFWRAAWLHETDGQAEANYRKGLELDPTNSVGLMSLGDFLVDDHPQEAQKLYDRAVLIDPRSARLRYESAGSGRRDEEQELLEVLQIDPNFVPALIRLGKLRWLRGEFAEGIKLAERGVAADPLYAWPRHHAYIMYLDMEDVAAVRDVSDPVPESAGNARFQLFQYTGDWRAAGEAAYAQSWLKGHFVNWRDAEALRDMALRTRDHQRAIRFIESARDLREPWKLTPLSVHRAVALAHLLQESGRRTDAVALLEQVFAWIAQDRSGTRDTWIPTARLRADALALQGRRDAALAALADAFRSGDRTLWWYTIERDPLWDSLRSDPLFQAIAAEARAHAAGQRALLEEMRRKAEVPVRPK